MSYANRITPIQQPEEDACGPVAIEIALEYFGMKLSFDEIVKISSYEKEEGMSNIQLVNSLQKAGLLTKVITPASWQDLQDGDSKSLAIVSWMLNGYIGHFSVVDRVTDTHIYLNNPETGSIEEIEKLIFMRLWFDYDDMWYPEKNTDIQLRWMVLVQNP